MSQLRFAVVDLETTGLHPGTNHRIVELAVVHLDGAGRITGTWETLLNPGRDLGAQSIHGIRASDVLEAPTFEQIAGHLIRLLEGRVMVAHNVGFDHRFLEAEFRRTGREFPFSHHDALCTMHLARTFLPGSRRALKDCCAAFDIELTDAHSARGDAMATARLLSSYLHMEPGLPIWKEAMRNVHRILWPHLPVIRTTGVVRRPADVKEPHFLERIAIQMPDSSGPAAHTEYMALLDRCLLDRRLSVHERNALVDLASTLGIGRSSCEQIHQLYFEQLTSVAWEDGILTAEERHDLETVAELLSIDETHLRAGLAGPPARNTFRLQEKAPLLAPGDKVVLTGEMGRPRAEWERLLVEHGFKPWAGVTGEVKLVAAGDPDSLSGKARKAREYGIPIVDEKGLERLVFGSGGNHVSRLEGHRLRMSPQAVHSMNETKLALQSTRTPQLDAPALAVDIAIAPTLSFAMEQSGVPLIRSAQIRNEGASVLQGAELVLRLEPGLSEPQRISIPPLLPDESAELGVLDVRLPPGRLREVTEKERAQLVWSVQSSGESLARGVTDVDVLPFNQWAGYLGAPPALLASFVTPNHPVIGPLLRRVAKRLGGSTGSSALDGYQQRDPARVRSMVEALYEELSCLGIAYAEVPASFEQTGQKVRLPDQVLADQIGCCLDLSLLFASCLEQMGLAPLVVAIHGHAFPAVWLVDDRFPEGLLEDPGRLRTQLELGQILTWESTLLTNGAPFEQALAIGRSHLRADETFVFALDVRSCRSEFRPLPMRMAGVPVEEDDAPTPQRIEIVRILRSAAEAPVPAREPDPVPEDVATRFRRWKDRLLDLTLRNKLLNLRPDRREVLPLQIPDLGAFEDLLATNERFEIVGRPLLHGRDDRDPGLLRTRVETEEGRQRLLGDLARKVLHSHLPQDRLHSQAVELIRSTRTDLEEGGATTLFVTVGMLKWTELGTRQERLAPLILYPVELGFEKARARLTLKRLDDQDPIANVTLIEKLRRDFAIDLSGLADLDTDEAGLDVKGLLDGVRKEIQARSGFEVLEEAHVARLSFSKFLMWKDLEDNAHHLLENPVVRHIAGVDSVWQDTVGDVAPGSLDETVPPQALPAVLDADSTQLAAVVAALRGRSFVLQGPPGTGKSQTITNLVAAAIGEGKSVLFVSEKMAALDVVHRRLQQVGLGDFCLELHSHKANKKDVLHSFATSVERLSRTHVSQWESESKRLAEMRLRLNEYAKALHLQRSVGFTVYEASARLGDLLDGPEIRVSIPNASSVDEGRMQTLRESTAAFADRAEAVEPVQANPWRLSRKAQFFMSDEEALTDALAGVRDAAERCEREAGELEKAAGATAPRSLPAMWQLSRLALAASEGELPQAALGERWEELSTRATDWLAADERWRSQRDSLGERWQPSFLERSDLESLHATFQKWAGAFFLLAFLFLWGARRRLRTEAKGVLGDNRSVLSDLAAGLETRQEGRRLESERLELGGLLDPTVLTRGQVVREARQLPTEHLVALVQRSATMAQERRDHLARSARALSSSLDTLSRHEEAVRTLAEIPHGDGWPFPDDPQQIPQLALKAGELLGARQRYRAHCLYNETAAQLEALGHGALVEAHREGRLAAQDVPAAFERNFLTRWLAEITDQEPALRSFDDRTQDRLVGDFAALDRHHLDLSRAWVIAKAEERLPPPGAPAVAGGEMQILRREIAKKTRHMAVRRLLLSLPELLPRLKPCLLMSPLSVAQYLPPTSRFDLVVFDEASQMGPTTPSGPSPVASRWSSSAIRSSCRPRRSSSERGETRTSCPTRTTSPSWRASSTKRKPVASPSRCSVGTIAAGTTP